LYPKK